ncbi:MAG: hypothetical protein ABIH09_03835 [Candidatus Omnitrophota bacterium]
MNYQKFIIGNMLNMNVFFVFDSFINIDQVKALSSKVVNGQIYLFPLTSKSSIIKAVDAEFKTKGYETHIISSVEVINVRDKLVRDKYIEFVSAFPEKISWHGKNLKEIFRIDKNLSFWWLSSIAEKNVYKSDAFNRLVQMDSIVSEILRYEVSEVIYSAGSSKLKKALCEFSRNNRISFKVLKTRYNLSFRENLCDGTRFVSARHFFIATAKSVSMFLRVLRVKMSFVLLNKKRNEIFNRAPIMIVTPYPDFDKAFADKGKFKNRYYVHLQEGLAADKENIVWISMFVRNKAVSFDESVKCARTFAEKGNGFFMLEEFVSLNTQIKALWKIAASSIKFLFLKRKIREASNFGKFNAYTFFENDWYSSFAGSDGYYSLVLYYTFMNIFNNVCPAKAVYPCEMRAWEKAFIAARNAVQKETVLFASQSGTVPKMHMNFFNHPDELNKEGSYPMPQADEILCNGPLSREYMMESGWQDDKIKVVEALRYMYLKDVLEKDFSSLKKKKVILLLSISPEESSSILSMSYDAFKDMNDVEVWIKPHPFLDLDKVFYLSGVPKQIKNFTVKEGPLKDFLPEAMAAVTGESSAAVEALAFGCRVLIVNVPEWINLSPLRFVNTDIVATVSSSEELKTIIMDTFSAKPFREVDREKRVRVVDSFFYTNKNSDIPEKFLRELKGV